MKKQIIVGLLGGLTALLPFAGLRAQPKAFFAFHPQPHFSGSRAEETRTETPSYKSYIGVYVRARVMRTFLESFPQATHVQWHLNEGYYFASFTEAGRLCKALFDTRGALLYSMQYGTERNLPRDVRHSIKAAYQDYQIDAVSEVESRDAKYWIVNLQHQDRLIVVQVLDGAIEELHRYTRHF